VSASTGVAPGAVESAGPGDRLRGWVDFYLTSMRVSIAVGFQYRVANYFYLIGMLAEPVIYLVVWSTIAEQQGGSVGGFTAGAFAAYYIVWTLVRAFNIGLTPWAWEERIKQGRLSILLLRPMHPVHYDLADLAGWKFVVIVLWLPIAAVLSIAFRPVFTLGPLEVVVFFASIWLAYVLRSLMLWLLGLVSFWTTRVGPFFDIFFTAELLLSGRLVPMSLLPPWAQDLAGLLPFQWTFAFPIESVVADLSDAELLTGLGVQVAWIAGFAIAVRLCWGVAVRRFSSVGG
jgi:ABC-2 type transport system permease protein